MKLFLTVQKKLVVTSLLYTIKLNAVIMNHLHFKLQYTYSLYHITVKSSVHLFFMEFSLSIFIDYFKCVTYILKDYKKDYGVDESSLWRHVDSDNDDDDKCLTHKDTANFPRQRLKILQ